MSGIVGIWHRDGRPVDAGTLMRLAATLRHRGGDAESIRVTGAVGLGCCLARRTPESLNETQPATAADGTMLVFDGRLDDRNELIAVLHSRGAVPEGSSDSALALAAFRVFGDDFPARLTGDFALALYDPRFRRMVLARDAVGIRPIYYADLPGLLLFASEIKAIVSHPAVEARPDEAALAACLFTRGAGQDPGESTCFENVRRVLPAHSVIVGSNGAQRKQYWDFDVTRRVTFARAGDYAEAFKEHFDRAVRRRLRSTGPAAVSVSGGLDSSAIFCAAHALARSGANGVAAPVGVSFTYPDGAPADEKAYLATIERLCATSIVRLHNPPIGITDRCNDGVWHTEEPLLDSQWNATQAVMSSARSLGASVQLTGHWGDQFLFDDAYLVDLCRRGRWRTAWSHVTTYGRWMDVPDRTFKRRLAAGLLKYHVPHSVLSMVRRLRNTARRRPPAASWYTDRFVRLARPAPRRRPPGGGTAHARSLYAEVRSQYNVACMESNNKIAAMHGLDMAFPFLDRDLIAFLMAIPGEFQTRDGIPKALLRDGCAGVLPDEIRRRASKADFTDRVNAGVVRDRNVIAGAIRKGMAVERGYLRQDAPMAIDAIPIDIDAPSAVNAWALNNVFALELWLREFVGPQRRCQSWRVFEDAQAI